MALRQFEYRVAVVQQNRVTFINNKWAGRVEPTVAGALDSCEEQSAWLNQEGLEGWKLVSAMAMTASGQNLTHLYLRRELAPRG
jgi:SH3-like domain-containing protein